MKKPVHDSRVVVRAPQGPLFSLASAWRAAENRGTRTAEPAPRCRTARSAAMPPQRPTDEATER
jgi:hypothetical protein